MGLEFKNVRVYGLEESVKASGLPMRMDTPNYDKVGSRDFDRAKKLGKVKSGSGHDNFLKGIVVQFDMRYPEYLTPQLQRYHWIDIVSSQSKMHKLSSIDEFTNDMFAHDINDAILYELNLILDLYKDAKSKKEKDYYELKLYSNLPCGYMKWMRISTNYLQLKTIYFQRKNHKLPEWRTFIEMIEGLPYFKEFINIK